VQQATRGALGVLGEVYELLLGGGGEQKRELGSVGFNGASGGVFLTRERSTDPFYRHSGLPFMAIALRQGTGLKVPQHLCQR
jgi:hypothetical protein